MGKFGPILGLIGAALLAFGGLWTIMIFMQLEQQFLVYGYTFANLGINSNAINLSFILTLVLSIVVLSVLL